MMIKGMDNFLDNFPTKVKILACVILLILFIIPFIIGRCTKEPITLPARIDTVKIDKPCPPITTVKEDTKPKKPLPPVTPYKVSDIVCAWDRWTGVILEIDWSTKDPNILIYKVQTYSDTDGWIENWYFATEFTPGKCN